jgi:hypothetical protein
MSARPKDPLATIGGTESPGSDGVHWSFGYREMRFAQDGLVLVTYRFPTVTSTPTVHGRLPPSRRYVGGCPG